MARLAVAAVLLVVTLCRVIDGEAPHAAASPSYPFEPAEEAAVLPDANGGAGAYNARTSVAVPPYLDGAATADEAAVQSYVLPAAAAAATSPEGPVSLVDDADQGFLRFPCRYRHMRWARRHGLLRQDGYYGFHRHGEGFQSQDQEKQLAEVPVGVQLGYGGETRERVVLPVAEPDPDSRPDAAVAAEEPVRKPAFHGEEEDEDEMARAWRRFHHGRRFHHHRRHHHHNDEQEEDHDHEQADEVSPMKRFHSRHDDDEEEESEMRTTKRFHHHHRDKDDDSDDEDELEEMARRWIRKALMRSRIHHHGRRFQHHHLRFRHRAEGDAAGEEEKGGVMRWLKDFVNRF